MAPGPIVIVPETLRLVTALTMALLFEMAKFLNDVAEKPPIVWAFEPLKMTAAVVLGVKVPPLSYQLPLTVIGNVDAASVPDVSVKFPLIVVAAPSVVVMAVVAIVRLLNVAKAAVAGHVVAAVVPQIMVPAPGIKVCRVVVHPVAPIESVPPLVMSMVPVLAAAVAKIPVTRSVLVPPTGQTSVPFAFRPT